MKNRDTALIICTPVAKNGLSSGASLRTQFLLEMLEEHNLEVKILSTAELDKVKNEKFRVILITSYANAFRGNWAKKRSEFLWFDPYDSWTAHRYSMVPHTFWRNFWGFLWDFFWTAVFPKCDLITFISAKDAKKHRFFSNKGKTLILPIRFTLPSIKSHSKSSLVFMGDGTYLPNVLCLPKLNQIAEQLKMQIKVIGRGYDHQISRFSNLEFMGYVNSSDIFQKNDIHISPSDVGSGIKTKTALPLALGIKVVTSRISANGLKNCENMKVAESIDDYCKAIRDFSLSDNDYENKDTQDIYKVNNLPEVKKILENWLAERPNSPEEVESK